MSGLAILNCHHERPSGREGSAVSQQSFQRQQQQIPRFARNDNSREGSSIPYGTLLTQRSIASSTRPIINPVLVVQPPDECHPCKDRADSLPRRSLRRSGAAPATLRKPLR